MLTYFLGDYNTFRIRTKQIPSGSNGIVIYTQNMSTLEDFAFGAGAYTYNECESLLDITFNLEIPLNPIPGDEYRMWVRPSITSSTIPYTQYPSIWNGSLQVFPSQSVDKPAYVNQIPIASSGQDQIPCEVSRQSENEYILYEGGCPSPFGPTTTTTTTAGPTTTTTTSTTTTTTTQAPGTCECTLFINHGRNNLFGTASYVECGGIAVTQSIAMSGSLLVCAASGSATISGNGAGIQYGSQIPANPTCNTSLTSSCLESANGQCVTFRNIQAVPNIRYIFWWHDYPTNQIKTTVLVSGQSQSVCMVSGSWVGKEASDLSTLIEYGGSCTTGNDCLPTTTTTSTTTTTTSTTSTTTTTTTAAPVTPSVIFTFGNQIGGNGFDVCYTIQNNIPNGVGIQTSYDLFMSSDSGCTTPYGTTWGYPFGNGRFTAGNTTSSGSIACNSGGALDTGGPYYRTRISGSFNFDCPSIFAGFSPTQTFDLSNGAYQDLTFNGVTVRIQGPNCTLNNYVDCSEALPIEYLVVAGGGGGGWSNGDFTAGGGGAGGYVTGSATIVNNTSMPVTVGTGGGVGTFGSVKPSNGTDSSFNSQTATGGGYGGSSTGNREGGNGGSGGGAAQPNFSFIGLGTAGQGNNGYISDLTIPRTFGGPGGGAETAGGVGSANTGGSGKNWLDGNIFSAGGAGVNGQGGIGAGTAGSGGNGNDGSVGTSGQNGIVRIRYAGTTQKATGGTVTTSGGYTYHSFFTSGNFQKTV